MWIPEISMCVYHTTPPDRVLTIIEEKKHHCKIKCTKNYGNVCRTQSQNIQFVDHTSLFDVWVDAAPLGTQLRFKPLENKSGVFWKSLKELLWFSSPADQPQPDWAKKIQQIKFAESSPRDQIWCPMGQKPSLDKHFVTI